MANNNRAVIHHHVIVESGCMVNSSGGMYRQLTVTIVKKYVVIVKKYEELRAFDGTKKVSIRNITNKIKVDWHTAKSPFCVTRQEWGTREWI